MDGRPHRMATLDDDRGEKSIFYVGHLDGRPAGYAKNNRSGEETRWKSSALSMSKEQFAAVAPTKIAEREADRAALYERTAERLSAQLEAYPALSPDHEYLQAKRIKLEPSVYQTPRGSMAIPAYDADGKLWSIQYVAEDGEKRFARESRKDGCFHVVGSTDLVGDLEKAAAIVVAEGYATAATLKSLHAEAGDPLGRVAFVAAFDAGNVPHVARVLRERHLSAAMVIAADNDKAMEGQEVGRNPGLIKGQQAAEGAGAVLMAPSFSEEELEAGFSDWNDLASHDEVRKGLIAKELGQALQKAFALQDVLARHLASAHQSSVPSTEEEDDDAFDRENEVRANDQNISSGVNNDQDDEKPGWVLSSGDLQKEQKPVPAIEKDPRSQWDFRIGKNGVIEHFRSSDGRVAVRETGDKIEILDQDHDSLELALERAGERFGTYLHFGGDRAGARILVDIVVTHDLRVAFTDDRLNAQIGPKSSWLRKHTLTTP